MMKAQLGVHHRVAVGVVERRAVDDLGFEALSEFEDVELHCLS